MEYQIKLDGGALVDLLTVAAFAAKDKARPLIASVNLTDANGMESLTATGTDSYRLARITRPVVEFAGDIANGVNVTIPAEFADRITKTVKANKGARGKLPEVTIAVKLDDAGAPVHVVATLDGSPDVIGADAIDGNYPDVVSAIPSASGIRETDALAFNPHMLAGMVKLAPWCHDKKLTSARLVTITDHTRPFRIESSDGATVAVFMPVRVTR